MERLADGDPDCENRRGREQANDQADQAPPPSARPSLRAVDHAW